MSVCDLFAFCLQPRGGTVHDQFPVIRIDGLYYTMSLRMMKAVWCVPFFPFCRSVPCNFPVFV
jgi:hypothetical protein